MIKFISNSPKQTEKFAQMLASKITKGNTILLYGDMGAGKTTFTKYLLKAFGVQSAVTSPTFTIVNEYEQNGIKINHFDMYRLEDESDAQEIGLEEMLNSKDGINIVEWPQKASSFLPDRCIQISINILGETKREFLVEGIDE